MSIGKNCIRNFVIISHVDHGKSTLADRFLELTGTIEKRKMREQFLDQMDLEREKGITIKMQPVRMLWHSDRRTTQNETQNNAEDFLYGDITYKIRGLLFQVRKKIGLGHKEQVYHNALEIEFKCAGLKFESKKSIQILYEGKNIGIYQPDFVVADKILVELKALPEIGQSQIEQLWSYLKGCDYKLALLVNFGSKDLEIRRVVYDKARRSFLRDSASSLRVSAGVADQIENNKYILNLIDTPGHVDFSYEVSRALAAVEGAILLVDAGQGVQAQTIANLHLAREEGLAIIPVINKIDLLGARVEECAEEMTNILGCQPEDILKISAKTGEGVENVLRAVIDRVPPPNSNISKYRNIEMSAYRNIEISPPARALIFDSHFDPFRGVVAHMRVFDGEFSRGEKIATLATKAEAEILELGYFSPELKPAAKLVAGEIGYIATGLKEPEMIRVGDTTVRYIDTSKYRNVPALPGYREPKPVVFASIYPESADDYPKLHDALKKIKLNDASIFFEPESSDVLGRGFRAGFLGMLHMEIASERLRREYGLNLIFTTPSVAYLVVGQDGGERRIYSASRFPDESQIKEIKEPWVKIETITPQKFLGGVMSLLNASRGSFVGQDYVGSSRLAISYEMPLKDILVDFFDALKSVTEGYGSFGYELLDYRRGDLLRLDILVAGEREEAFSQVVPRERAYDEGKKIVGRLKELLPRQLFQVSIQAAASGRIIARETLPALKKDVTGYLYGGDRTRKMKLWKKQQKGKERLKKSGRVEIPPEVFLKLLRRS